MHYYPEDTSRDNLRKLIRTNVCSECGRQLYAYLDSEKKVYLACSNQTHEGIAREYQAPIEDYRSNIRREIELEEKHGRGASTALAIIPKQGQLTQPQATTVLNLIYPKATAIEIERCAIFCRDFGLHPLANEVYLIPFKGKNVMVVGIAANRKMAHALKGDFSFLDDTPRAATEEEVVKQYGKDSDEARDFIISVTKLQGVGGNLAIGFGLWPKLRQKMAWNEQAKRMVPVKKDGDIVMEPNEPYGLDKGNSKRNMANIHSERQGIDRLPGKAMPKDYEVVDAKYTVLPEVGKVDTKTGEVMEDKPPEVEPAVEAEFTEVPPEPEPEAKVEPPATGRVDMPWLIESVNTLKWDILQYIKDTYKVETSGNLGDVVERLNDKQVKELCKEVQDRLDMK